MHPTVKELELHHDNTYLFIHLCSIHPGVLPAAEACVADTPSMVVHDRSWASVRLHAAGVYSIGVARECLEDFACHPAVFSVLDDILDYIRSLDFR